jgi:SAM-dependent methyltransferase
MKKEKIIKEKKFLNKIYHRYKNLENEPQTQAMRELAFNLIKPHLNKNNIALELGCSDGFFTSFISTNVNTIDVVDATKKNLDTAKQKKLRNANYYLSLFEEFKTKKKYDCIIASYILEHVLDHIKLLKIIKKLLKPDGKLFIIVPNAKAFSRQLAVKMGLYKDLKELTKNDISYGHRRVFDRNELNKSVEKSGLKTIYQTGIMFKILADFQMDILIKKKILGREQINGLFQMGLDYPEFSGSLFSICQINK